MRTDIRPLGSTRVACLIGGTPWFACLWHSTVGQKSSGMQVHHEISQGRSAVHWLTGVIIVAGMLNKQENSCRSDPSAHKTMKASIEIARSQLSSGKSTTDNLTQDTLAVMLLSNNANQTCHALQNLIGQLLTWNPLDIFVFSLNNSLYTRNAWEMPQLNVIFMSLYEHWETPDQAGSRDLWTASRFGEDYRRMGHWRLAFQMEFALELGYKFVLQIDDDSAFLQPIEYNLIQYMASHDLKMAARNIIAHDEPDVTQGLAELAKFFLVSEGLQPKSLFIECRPANISGLYTSGVGGTQDGGYSTKYIYGNFVIISLDFWFQEEVQRLVKLVLSTGGHFRHRWNEQQVQSLVWQIFLARDEFHLFDFPYEHPVKV